MADTKSKRQPLSPNLTLIFPMAGRGERFGATFKPFLRVGDQAFIEAAVQPFRKWRTAISRIMFVFLRQQELEFSVTARLAEMFDGLPWEAVILEQPTAGPAVTLAAAVEQGNVVGPAIVCDCDHAVHVDPMFAALQAGPTCACMLPIWDLSAEDIKSWSVVSLANDGAVLAIAEKSIPNGAIRASGVIGCYYFQDVAQAAAECRQHHYLVISDVVSHLLGQGAHVATIEINEAKFFGDPARLAKAQQADVAGACSNIEIREK